MCLYVGVDGYGWSGETVCASVYVCTSTCMQWCGGPLYSYIYTYIHTHTHTHTVHLEEMHSRVQAMVDGGMLCVCVYISTCVCVCVCVYVRIYGQRGTLCHLSLCHILRYTHPRTHTHTHTNTHTHTHRQSRRCLLCSVERWEDCCLGMCGVCRY
jgi:hypothetical protein